MLKQLIKEAILEALVEFTNQGIMTADETGENNETPKEDDESGKGGGSDANSGGGTSNDGRPKPNVGVGVWSRK